MKKKLIDILMAALVGGLIAFLTQFLQGLAGIDFSTEASGAGGISSAVTYFVRALKHT